MRNLNTQQHREKRVAPLTVAQSAATEGLDVFLK